MGDIQVTWVPHIPHFHIALGPERSKVGFIRFGTATALLNEAVEVNTSNEPAPSLVLLQERPKFGKEEFRLSLIHI